MFCPRAWCELVTPLGDSFEVLMAIPDEKTKRDRPGSRGDSKDTCNNKLTSTTCAIYALQ